MEIIKRLLFGKKVEVEVPLIGNLHCRVNNTHPTAIYGWTNYDCQLVPGSYLVLEGNFEGPFERHIKNYLDVTSDVNSIVEATKTKFLKDHPAYQLKSISKGDFNVIGITCRGQITVDLIVRIPNKSCYIVNWREGKIHSIK